MNEANANPSTHATQVFAGHVVSPLLLVGTFVALVVLTGLTYAATWIDLGALNIWIALAIATVKAVLVALVFMHLAWDRPINAIILFCALVFVVLFISLTLADSLSYQRDRIPGYMPALKR